MSYSFVVIGASKAEAVEKVAAELDKVVNSQSAHAADRDAALVAARAFVDLLRDLKGGEEISVNMHGSLGWQHPSDAGGEFYSANVGVTAQIVKTG